MSLGTAAVLAKANVPVGVQHRRLHHRLAAPAAIGRAGGARGIAARQSHRRRRHSPAPACSASPRASARCRSGKDADFVVLSGDPLSVYTRVEQTWVEGRKVFDLANPADHLFAVGGYGATRDEVLHSDDEEDR